MLEEGYERYYGVIIDDKDKLYLVEKVMKIEDLYKDEETVRRNESNKCAVPVAWIDEETLMEYINTITNSGWEANYNLNNFTKIPPDDYGYFYMLHDVLNYYAPAVCPRAMVTCSDDRYSNLRVPLEIYVAYQQGLFRKHLTVLFKNVKNDQKIDLSISS